MKQMSELLVGESAKVTVDKAELGYSTIQGVEYFVMGSDDLTDASETNFLDTYYVSKDYKKVYIAESYDLETPVGATVKRIK